jgi:hypothetical protein
VHHVIDVPAHIGALGDGLLREFAISEDCAEVVCDSSGEGTHRVHLLGLAKQTFESLLLYLDFLDLRDEFQACRSPAHYDNSMDYVRVRAFAYSRCCLADARALTGLISRIDVPCVQRLLFSRWSHLSAKHQS